MTLLIDIGALTERETDHALELIHKAITENGDEDAVWEKHPSPFIRRLIELFTQRGLLRLDGIRKEVLAHLNGARFAGGERPPRPDGSMYRWTPTELQLAKLYLSSLPPGEWVLEDHMLMVDYLVQRYLPADDLRAESEWLATRSTLMGRVQANMPSVTMEQADKLIGAMPLTVRSTHAQFRLNPRQLATLNFAASSAADRVQKVSDDTRYRLRNLIRRHVEQQTLRDPTATGSSLQTKLIDEFGRLNRDWRRIAVTEAGEAANQGMVASVAPGHHLKRVEQYRGACAFCKKIDGRVVEVVAPDEPIKDGEKQVWAGKSNMGRSASPNKRVGQALIEREPDERWWVPAGTVHPNCRGRWVAVAEPREGDDPDFAAWLKATLSGDAAP